MIHKLLVFIGLAVSFMACSGGSSGPKFDLKGFQTESVGGGAKYASFKDQNGWPLSTGHVINDVKNGVWLTYHPNSYNVKTASNYVNGKKNGPEFNFSERGSLESVTGYRNDQLHGLSASYRNGRTMGETNYANGVMHGPFSIYDERSGKIQRSGFFSNGKQHGELLYYDDQGNITLRYEYNEGEKVGGGIIEQ